MDSHDLFVHLLHRLGHYAEATVLWVLLKEGADVQEYKTSSTRIALDQLPDTIDRYTAQRAFKRLADRGLVHVRIHRKTATLITVDRTALLNVLEGAGPLDERLPGLSQNPFPFLELWTTHRSRAGMAGTEPQHTHEA